MKKKGTLNHKEKIKVAIRLRPYIEQDIPEEGYYEEAMLNDRQILHIKDDKTIITNAKTRKAHKFDQVLSQEVTQDDLYED